MPYKKAQNEKATKSVLNRIYSIVLTYYLHLANKTITQARMIKRTPLSINGILKSFHFLFN